MWKSVGVIIIRCCSRHPRIRGNNNDMLVYDWLDVKEEEENEWIMIPFRFGWCFWWWYKEHFLSLPNVLNDPKRVKREERRKASETSFRIKEFLLFFRMQQSSLFFSIHPVMTIYDDIVSKISLFEKRVHIYSFSSYFFEVFLVWLGFDKNHH